MFTMKFATMMKPKTYCQAGVLMRLRAKCCAAVVSDDEAGKLDATRARARSISHPHFFQFRSFVVIFVTYSCLELNKSIPVLKNFLTFERKNILSTSVVPSL